MRKLVKRKVRCSGILFLAGFPSRKKQTCQLDAHKIRRGLKNQRGQFSKLGSKFKRELIEGYAIY